MNRQKLSVITLLVITFVMISISTTQAQTIQDKAICYGYGTADLQPKGVGNTVFQYTEKVGFWVQIQDPPDVTYRMKWTDPDGSEFRNVAVTVVDKSGETWGIVFDSINIAESLARNRLGVWTVELYADGNLEASSEFQIISYSDLLADIQDIQDQVQDIVEAKDELQNNYNDLQDDYEA